MIADAEQPTVKTGSPVFRGGDLIFVDETLQKLEPLDRGSPSQGESGRVVGIKHASPRAYDPREPAAVNHAGFIPPLRDVVAGPAGQFPRRLEEGVPGPLAPLGQFTGSDEPRLGKHGDVVVLHLDVRVAGNAALDPRPRAHGDKARCPLAGEKIGDLIGRHISFNIGA